MCKKKDKIRQSDAKISLMIMVKIKEWSSKLHVEQLPSKKPEGKKKKNQAPSWIPNHNLGDATANTPPILTLNEPHLTRAGQTNVERKIVTQGETMMSAKLLIRKHKACWLYGSQSHAGILMAGKSFTNFTVPANSLERWVWFSNQQILCINSAVCCDITSDCY